MTVQSNAKGTGVRAKPILVIHVHCPECDACLCVRETGWSEVVPSASIRADRLNGRFQVICGEGEVVSADELECEPGEANEDAESEAQD